MMRKRLLILLLAAAVLGILSTLYGPAATQRRGIQAAAAYRDQIAPSLAADPRFSDIDLSVSTHPALLVRGTVPDQRALSELQHRLQPPDAGRFQIIIHVQVAADDTTRRTAASNSGPQ